MEQDLIQEDESLALALHRQLNAPKRRSRRDEQPERKKYSTKIDDLEASSDSEADEDEGEARAAEEKPREKQKGAAARRAKRKKPVSKPLETHEAAALSVVQKAAKTGKSKGGGAGKSHCKCFLSGLPWGVILHRDAFKDRETLAAAVSRAFERDGVTCKATELDVTIVSLGKDVEHFPSLKSVNKTAVKQENGDEGKRKGEEEEEEEEERWKEAAKQAQRVYLSITK